MPPATAPATAGVAAPPRDDLALGALLSDSVDILRRDWAPLLVPFVVLAIVSGGGPGDGSVRYDVGEIRGDPLVLVPFYAVLGVLALAIVIALYFAYVAVCLVTTRMVFDVTEGRAPATFGQALREARADIVPAAGTVLLSIGAVVLGFLALLVPGFILLGGLFPLTAVLVAERARGRAALRRTWELTRGHRGTLLVLVLLGGLTMGLGSAAFEWVPILGRALSGVITGAVYALFVTAGALFYRRARGHAHVPVAAAPAVLEA